MVRQLFNNIVSDVIKRKYIHRLVINRPKKKEVVVFDRQLLWLLDRAILANISYGVICVRGEEININPLLVFKFLYTYITNNISASEAYFLALTQYHSPKVVVTYIDNSLSFEVLSKFYKKPEYFAIQNGFRCKEQLEKINNMPTFFCFGQREVELYQSCGILVDRYIPIGSSKFSYYRENIAKTSIEKKYDLCLVSQYRNGKINSNDPVWLTIRTMFEYMNRFINDTGYSLSIALTPKGQNDREEKEYFLSLFGGEVDLISNDKKFTSYVACDNSRVIVAFHSTLAFEFFGAGKKTLFCAGLGGDELSKKYNFNKPYSNLMTINEQGYDKFSKKLQTLINMDNDQYKNETERDSNYVMKNTSVKSHHLIRNEIMDKLNYVELK